MLIKYLEKDIILLKRKRSYLAERILDLRDYIRREEKSSLNKAQVSAVVDSLISMIGDNFSNLGFDKQTTPIECLLHKEEKFLINKLKQYAKDYKIL